MTFIVKYSEILMKSRIQIPIELHLPFLKSVHLSEAFGALEFCQIDNLLHLTEVRGLAAEFQHSKPTRHTWLLLGLKEMGFLIRP